MEIPVAGSLASKRSDPGGLLAFLIYLGFSLLILGRPLLGGFGNLHHGTGEDPTIVMWDLVWSPYALARHINPLYTNFIWAPGGINLAWVVTFPLASVLMWPVTAVFGPVAAYNVLSLLAPPMGAWSAFLLCRQVSRSWWPALIGGYVFGFSYYILGNTLIGTTPLIVVFLVPLAGLTALLAIDGGIRVTRFVCILAAILTAQFLTSLEILTGMTMFGAIALALGWWFTPKETSVRIARITLPILCAYAIMAVLVSPYLYWLFAFGWPRGGIWPAWNETYSADLLSFILPAPIMEVGSFNPFRDLWTDFGPAGWSINATYLGVPLIVIAAAYARHQWRAPAGKTLISLIAIACVFAMGPRLHISHNTALFAFPGKILLALPLVDKILPYRYMMYVSLFLAIIVSLWFASNQLSRITNFALAAIVVLSTMPSLSFPWVRPANQPQFFTSGIYRDYLKQGENVLVLPFGWRGDSMLWQADTNMYFRMVGGWTGLYPAEFDNWPVFHSFLFTTYLPDAEEQLGAFMAAHQVDAAVVADNDPDATPWKPSLAKFSNQIHTAGGITVYRISASALAPYSQLPASLMRQRAASATIDSLMLAAAGWIAAGRNPAQFDPAKAFEAGLLKDSWCAGQVTESSTGRRLPIVDPIHHWYCGVEIGGTPRGTIIIGAPGTFSDFASTVDRYRDAASHIYFGTSHDLRSPGAAIPPPDQRAFLRMEFAPDRIVAIAAKLDTAQPH
ncbi:MAG TPA: hypothetical protein VMU16_02330 [Candidatus Binataceae bacterium]|nr:hypothetical protein [Candidatus Binataceae bacterium]